MPSTFVSQPLRPSGDFDPHMMATGISGLPSRFIWNKEQLVVAELLETWKAYGDCAHGSGERYLRRHLYRLSFEDGRIAVVSFQRSFGRSARARNRWWLHTFESA